LADLILLLFLTEQNMGTYISHFRNAEILLAKLNELDENAFLFGSLAPDSGIPTDDDSSRLVLTSTGKVAPVRKSNRRYTIMRMEKSKFSLAQHKGEFEALVSKTEHETLAVWAIDCAERVLPYFEQKYPDDHRPRNALETLQVWINTGEFSMVVIRKASLDSHAAAREVGEDNAARSAARAAGQAVATAHVPTHAIGAAIYALQAIHRVTDPAGADAAVAKERAWQIQHLLELRNTKQR
jgi:hypothetical protein